MADVLLFHSLYGLRPAVIAAADRMRSAGHRVIAPDLYAGHTATTRPDGTALKQQVGWDTILDRARDAASALSPAAVLAGFSMGAGVAGDLLAERPDTAGLLLLHGTGGAGSSVRAGLAVQVHVAEPDRHVPAAGFSAWQDELRGAGAEVTAFTYPGVGHLFTDAGAADHDRPAATLTWRRCLTFLGSL